MEKNPRKELLKGLVLKYSLSPKDEILHYIENTAELLGFDEATETVEEIYGSMRFLKDPVKTIFKKIAIKEYLADKVLKNEVSERDIQESLKYLTKQEVNEILRIKTLETKLN